jgi:hypothetical protein
MEVRGKREGPVFSFTAGIHGSEFVGIEACLRLYHELRNRRDELSGTVYLLPMVNFPAVMNKVQFVNPLDGENMNYIFPPDPECGSISHRMLGRLLDKFLLDSDYHCDLHGGELLEELHPYVYYHKVGRPEFDQHNEEFARAFGIEYVIPTERDTPYVANAANLYAGVAESGVPSIQCETGGMGDRSEESIALDVNGMKRVLAWAGLLETEYEPRATTVLKGAVRVSSSQEGLFYPELRAGQQVEPGMELGTVYDVYRQEQLEIIRAAHHGILLWINTSLTVGPRDALAGIGIQE